MIILMYKMGNDYKEGEMQKWEYLSIEDHTILINKTVFHIVCVSEC